MNNKLQRFLIYFVFITVSLFLSFTLLDRKKVIAREKTKENVLFSVLVGAGTSATMVFFSKFNRKP